MVARPKAVRLAGVVGLAACPSVVQRLRARRFESSPWRLYSCRVGGMAYAPVLGTGGEILEGSSPSLGIEAFRINPIGLSLSVAARRAPE